MVNINPHVWKYGPDWKNNRARDAFLLKFLHDQMLQMDDPVVLDIGASVGNFSLLAKFCPGACVYAFEPNPMSYDFLVEHIQLNGLQEQVKPFKVALSDKSGQGTLWVPPIPEDAGLSTLRAGSEQAAWDELEIEVCRLDQFSSQWDRVDLIKMDAEGAELLILKGGQKTIEAHKPKILTEYLGKHAERFGYEPAALKELLFSWGYQHFQFVRGRRKELNAWIF